MSGADHQEAQAKEPRAGLEVQHEQHRRHGQAGEERHAQARGEEVGHDEPAPGEDHHLQKGAALELEGTHHQHQQTELEGRQAEA